MKCFQNDFREINLKSNTGSDLISRRFQVNDFKGISGKSFSNQLFDLKLISKFDFNLISTKSILKLIIIILKSICFVRECPDIFKILHFQDRYIPELTKNDKKSIWPKMDLRLFKYWIQRTYDSLDFRSDGLTILLF